MPPLLELHRAIRLLLQAQRYADELKRDPWDFAVGWPCLREAGLTKNDIRWLIYRGFLREGIESAAQSELVAVRDPNGRCRLGNASCFLLTSDGLCFARELQADAERQRPPTPAVAMALEGHSLGCEAQGVLTPEWDSRRRTLSFDCRIVKRYKVPAPNQEIILATFEEEEWPVRIDDPLPQNANVVAKQRLHDTITSLNRNQKSQLLHFFGDGSGEAICWEIRADL